jgi:hypothetical protein
MYRRSQFGQAICVVMLCVYVMCVLEFVFIKLVFKLCLSWELGQRKLIGEVLEASDVDDLLRDMVQ